MHDCDESLISHDQENDSCITDITKAGVRETAAVKANKLLVSLLNAADITAFGVCGFDGNLLELRLKTERSNGTAEIAMVRTFWLDAITEKGGVPVIAGVGSTVDGTWKKLDANELAIRCAVAWNADVLMFLINEDGVKDRDGTVMRWLDARSFDQIDRNSLGTEMMARLNGCLEALEGGVRRTRIYPYSRIEILSDFFFTRLDYGTEVTTAVPARGAVFW